MTSGTTPPRAEPPVAAAPTRRDLEQAASIAVESFARCFSEMFPRIEEELFSSAEKEGDRSRQSRILDAYGLVRTQRKKLEQEFRHAIEQIVKQRLFPHAVAGTKSAAPVDYSQLSLVDEQEVETDIVIKRLVARLRQHEGSKTGAELSDLDDRLSYLLGKQEMGDDENPFSPDALARAVQSAFQELAAEQAVQAEILKTFEAFAAEAFHSAYHELNTHFVDRNVLPDIQTYRRQRYAAHVGRGGRDDAAATQPTRTVIRTREDIASAREEAARMAARAHDGLLDRFSRFRATQPTDGPAASGTPDTFWPVITRSVVDHLPALVPSGTAVAAAMSGVVNAPLADLNLLHQVRQNARQMGAPRDEEILIDLVAVLVDKILQDKQVPERIKRLIARLQVPLLKAALLDKNLFATPAHPARLLLDAIARHAVGWSEDNDAEGRFYQLVFDIVSVVETKFDRDIALFADQTARLEAFMADEKQREAERYADAAALLERVEQREVADMQALEQIREAVENLELSEELTEFLLGPWRKVLVESSLNDSAGPGATTYRKTLKELVWSVQPKVTQDERRALVSALPDLLKRLRAGLTLIQSALPEQDVFFAQLMQAHSAAVKVGVRTQLQDVAFQKFESRVEEIKIDPALAPDVEVRIAPEALKATVAQVPVPLAVADDPVTPPTERLARPARITREYVNQLMNQMVRGVWVELAGDDGIAVAQLRWISPRRSMYLFTDREGKHALTYTPDVLRLQIAEGLIAPLDSKALTERALDSIEESIGALV